MYRSISFALRVNMYAMNHNCSSHPRALAVISRTSPSKQPYGAAHRKALARAVHVSAAYNGVESDNLIQPGLAYSAEWNEAYWRTRPVTVQKRLITIGWAVTKWQVWKRVNGSTPDAPYLLKILAELGPAFVKIGQAVSTRADVVPPEYLRELEKLQDDIPAYDTAEAFTVIQTDLGRPVSELFSVITPEPVAAASLGQVYKATLKATGEVVAVKVQRPGVMETIALDIFILRNLAWWLRRLGKLNSDLPGLIDEWAASIYREMSYIEERNNAVEFKEMFAHYTEIYVPRMYDEYSSERVLTMEWVDGQKPRSGSDNQVGTSSPDDIRLVEVGVRCSLEQMLQEGLYHSDPHPGNLLRMPDGRLCYLDFGMMGRIDRPVRQALIQATVHLVNGEFEYLSSDFITLGMLPADAAANKTEIVYALTSVFEEAIAQGLSKISFGGLAAKLGQTMYKYKFRIPTYFTLLVRSFAILEGIALAADPNYKVLSAAYPWISRKLLTDRSLELQATLRNILYKDGMFRFARLESLLTQAVQSPSRPSRLSTTSPSSNGSTGSAFAKTSALELLLSDDGEFLRDIVLDELAKGIDAAWRVNLDSIQSTARTSALSLLGLTGQERNVADGEYDSIPGARLVGSMLRIAPLSNERDVEQVQGIMRLTAVIQQLANRRSDDARPVAPGAAWDPASLVASTAAMLKWVRDETSGLPPAAQQRALLLPADLLGRVSTRAAARSIRLILGAPERSTSSPAVPVP